MPKAWRVRLRCLTSEIDFFEERACVVFVATSAEYSMVEGRINKLEGRKAGLEEMRIEPDAPFDKDAFFPRFFDKSAIRRITEKSLLAFFISGLKTTHTSTVMKTARL